MAEGLLGLLAQVGAETATAIAIVVPTSSLSMRARGKTEISVFGVGVMPAPAKVVPSTVGRAGTKVVAPSAVRWVSTSLTSVLNLRMFVVLAVVGETT